MNALFFATLVCVGAVVSASGWAGHDDGQWRGEGLAESQDHGQWGNGLGVAAHGAYGAGVYGAGVYGVQGVPSIYGSHGVYAHGLAPLSHDGVVVDTPEVAYAKAAHASAVARLSHGIAHGGPVYGGSVYGGLASGAYGGGYGGRGAWAHGGAPIGHNGQVVDTPEVAHAKAAHFAAIAAASHGAYGHY